MTLKVAERPHGYAKYKLEGCRCYTCGWERSRYEERRQRAIAAGTWKPFTDAEPVRAHVRELMRTGIGYKRIAVLGGVSRTMQKLLYGKPGAAPTKRVRSEVAGRLLAVRPEAVTAAAGAVVDATGTHRRIQALAWMGWSLGRQAECIGWTNSNYCRILRYSTVVQGTADKVRALFEQFSMRPAPDGSSATRARRMARARGWQSPLAWDEDEIDDPKARPKGRR